MSAPGISAPGCIESLCCQRSRAEGEGRRQAAFKKARLFLVGCRHHAERLEVGVEDRFLFHALVVVLLADRNDLAQDLGVETLHPCTICMLLVAVYSQVIRRLGGFLLTFESKPGELRQLAEGVWLAVIRMNKESRASARLF